MEITVLWSDSAIKDLQDIHDYFLAKASLKVSQKLVTTIINKSDSLSSNPRLGQTEELLKHKNKEIRYLVEGNFKIIFLTGLKNVEKSCGHILSNRENIFTFGQILS